MINVTLLGLGILLLGISALFWAGLLRLGLRWRKVEGVTWGGVLLVTLVVTLVDLVLRGGIVAGAVFVPDWAVLVLGISAILMLVLPILIVTLAYRLPVGQGLLAWLPTLLTPLLLVPILLLVVKPFLLEAYAIPTNAMAPTLVGPHWETACETCGAPAIGSLPREQFLPVEPMPVICQRDFHVTENVEFNGQTYGADRILAVKFVRPQRWDLIVFRNPENPEINYVKRLVGLPGETITIDNGMVYADGKPLDLPEHLHGLEYANQIEGPFSDLAGTPDYPAELGPDEYFVLGDFSIHSLDSRMWQRGAEGHNPYAVPESHLIGVVTHLYWPVRRWRAFR